MFDRYVVRSIYPLIDFYHLDRKAPNFLAELQDLLKRFDINPNLPRHSKREYGSVQVLEPRRISLPFPGHDDLPSSVNDSRVITYYPKELSNQRGDRLIVWVPQW